MSSTPITRRSGDDGIVIAGGGLAAQRCAETLRREGFDGPIRVVCGEPHRPYDKPPLSKGLLKGTHHGDALAYRAADWYGEQSVDLLLSVHANGLTPGERTLSLSDGAVLRYEQLLIATGGRPRTLPLLAGYDNVSTLRTLDDALVLRDVLGTGPRLAVIGAGFVGLEVAATARELGAEVTLVEAASQPLESVLGPGLGAWFAWLHQAEGVRILTGRTLHSADVNGTVRSLRLSDATAIPVDHIVVGVGIAPDVAWLNGSGLGTGVGIPVDPDGRTAIPGVFAAGDAAATFDPASGRHIPGSHWEAAGRQGARAARAMLGIDPGARRVTSFWTDQFGLRIHFVGRADGADAVALDGDPRDRSFTATFTRAGRAVAALLVDRPRSLPAARASIEKGTP